MLCSCIGMVAAAEYDGACCSTVSGHQLILCNAPLPTPNPKKTLNPKSVHQGRLVKL